MIGQALFLLFPLALVFGAVSDVMSMTIPNWLVLAMLAVFVLLAPFSGMGWPVAGLHFAAGAVVLAGAFAFFAFGWIGGGDAKLAAAIALWLGWDHLLEFALVAAVFGGVLTLAVLAFRRAMLPGFALWPWLLRLHDSKSGVPYGLALAAAGLVIYPRTGWIGLVTG